MNCTAFLGGITKNYGTNLSFGKIQLVKNIQLWKQMNMIVHFWLCNPDLAVITSMDADHLDIYGDHSYMVESYRLFAQQVKPSGSYLFVRTSLWTEVGMNTYRHIRERCR